YRLVRMGKTIKRFDDGPGRVRAEAVVVVGQSKLLQRLLPGLMHAAIFWGFIVLLPTIAVAMIGIVDQHATLPWLGEQGWYALLVDVFALLVLAGVITAFAIRKVQKPGRFAGRHLREHQIKRAPGTRRLRDHSGGGRALRHGDRRRDDLETDGGHDVLHRVWPVPGSVPRLQHGQGALAEAPDHGPPRPDARRRAEG